MSDYCRGGSDNPKDPPRPGCVHVHGRQLGVHGPQRDLLQGNPRLAQTLRQLKRLGDVPAVFEHEANRPTPPQA